MDDIDGLLLAGAVAILGLAVAVLAVRLANVETDVAIIRLVETTPLNERRDP
jgi:hypothetical protein